MPRREPTITILTWYFPLWLMFMALSEELIFRLVPTYFAIEEFKCSKRSVILILTISAIIFGLLHGNYLNIFSQGVAGMLYSILYFKCGGFQAHYIKALTVTTIAHAAYNGVVAALILSNGGTKF